MTYLLVVSNALTVRAWTSRLLQEHGVPASFSATRHEALKLVKEIGPPVALATQIDLGEWLDGFNLADTLRVANPQLATVFFTSAYPIHNPAQMQPQDIMLGPDCGAEVFLAAIRRTMAGSAR